MSNCTSNTKAGNWKCNKVGPVGEPAVLLALDLNGSLQVLSRLQASNYLLVLPEMWVRLYRPSGLVLSH